MVKCILSKLKKTVNQYTKAYRQKGAAMPSMTKEEVEKKLALLEQEIRESSPALPLSRTYGVVFAGGGGKASYQAGAIKALSDLGLMPRITCTAGASAGALSCVLLANGSVKFAEKIWRSISLGDMLDFELP